MQPNKQPTKITFWGTLALMLKEAWFYVKHRLLSDYWQERVKQYSLLMRVDKPIGFFLLLWPTFWALWLAADDSPDFSLLVIFFVGVFLMRSAGCVINDYADRRFDGKVSRTKSRPMATGKVTEKEALIVFVILALLAFGLVLLLNQKAIILSFVALAVATIYPFMKRVTYFPQLVLGAAFSMSIPMAFAATNNELPSVTWLIYIANLLWVLAYDTLYAMVDRKDDIKAQIKSTAILFGEADLQLIGIIQGLFIFGMVLVGSHYELNYWYYLGLVIAAGMIVWQIWYCQRREPAKCFQAFLNNHWVGFVIFLGIILSKASVN